MSAPTVAPAALLADAAWLARYAGHRDVVLLDTRPAADYWAGHLPGARHFDALLFSHADSSPAGLDVLAAQYAYLFGLLGLSGDEQVVVYEARSDARAARAAWLLDYLGHPRVRLLDGGLQGLDAPALETAARAYAPRRFAVRRQSALATGADALAARLGTPGLRVLDTRRAAEYHGTEKRGKRSGAIPGAVHRDHTDNIGPDGRFLPAAELRAAYEALGLAPGDDVVAYCGGGARAAHTLYALRLAGFDRASVYPGSWNEWSARDDLPVAQPAPAAAA